MKRKQRKEGGCFWEGCEVGRKKRLGDKDFMVKEASLKRGKDAKH